MADEFTFRFKPGSPERTLLLLHGTGGNEESLLPLAKAIDPEAAVLAVRGKVLENGMPRFFRRFAEGVFDIDDLRFRTSELADFTVRSSAKFGFALASVVAVGYSNGANIGGSLLLLRPEVLGRAILIRPTLPLRPEVVPDLSRKSVLISAGTHDGLIPREGTLDLEELLKSAGADVTTNWVDADHGLVGSEVNAIRAWLVGTDEKP